MNKNKQLFFLTITAIITTILAIVSPITLYLGPIPFSLSLGIIAIISTLLPQKQALISVCLYLVVGAIGLPVFAGGGGGIGILLGPTGGYLWSYLLVTLLLSFYANSTFPKNIVSTILITFISLILCYSVGTIQYMLITNTSFLKALGICVLPFIPLDITKIIMGITIGFRIKKLF